MKLYIQTNNQKSTKRKTSNFKITNYYFYNAKDVRCKGRKRKPS